MKKAQKNVLGAFGLVLVAATTAFAAFMPMPDASAVDSTTDTLTLKVVGETPDINVTGITSGSTVVTPSHDIDIAYQNIGRLKVKIKYTNEAGQTYTYTLVDDAISGESGDKTMNFNFATGQYTYDGNTYTFPEHGYGNYVLTVTGEGHDGGIDEQNIAFSYKLIDVNVTEKEETGEVIVDLDYDTSGGSGEEVETITVNVYDENGNLVTPLSPVTVNSPTDQIILPFGDHDLPSGNYTVEVITRDKDGNVLYKSYSSIAYKAPNKDDDIVVPSTGTPDTGGLFGNLNISKSDYLITGLIIFFIVGVGGAAFIVRRHKKSSKR